MAARRQPAPTKPPQVERVALYSRVSSEDQADTETIQVQVEFLRRYAELHGLHVVDEYLDDGVSGTIPLQERPSGARMVADAKAGKLSTVIFYRVSRLGRRLTVVLGAYEELDAAGVVVRSATEPIDTAQPIGRFIFQMLAAFAELDRETILDNTSRGRARGAREGRWYGVVPTGYTVRDSKLVPNDTEVLPGMTEADLVRDIYRRIAAGESSIKVAESLTARGLSRFKRYARHDGREVVLEGTPGWPAKRVSEMVRNPTYRGQHIFEGRHGDVERQVPALVSEDLWHQACAQLDQNRFRNPRNSKQSYLLRGLIRCARCKVAFIGQSGGEGRRYYRCGYARSGGDRGRGPGVQCQAKLLEANAIERDVWAGCESYIRDPDAALDAAMVNLTAAREAAPDPMHALAQVREQLAAKTGERTDVLTLMRRRAISVDEAEQQLAAIEAEQAALRAELARLDMDRAAHDATEQQITLARDLLAELRRRLDEGMDDEVRRMVVQALVRRIEVTTEPGVQAGKKRRVRQARIAVEYVLSGDDVFSYGSC